MKDIYGIGCTLNAMKKLDEVTINNFEEAKTITRDRFRLLDDNDYNPVEITTVVTEKEIDFIEVYDAGIGKDVINSDGEFINFGIRSFLSELIEGQDRNLEVMPNSYLTIGGFKEICAIQNLDVQKAIASYIVSSVKIDRESNAVYTDVIVKVGMLPRPLFKNTIGGDNVSIDDIEIKLIQFTIVSETNYDSFIRELKKALASEL